MVKTKGPIMSLTARGTVADEVTAAEGATLHLNGLGLREFMWIDIYVGGLYLPEKTHDPAAAMASLDRLEVPADNARMVLQAGILRSDVYAALGYPDSARAVLQGLTAQFPDNPMVQRVVGEASAKLP